MKMDSVQSKKEKSQTKEEAICAYLQFVVFDFEDELEVSKIRTMLKPKGKAVKKGNK
jgi:hypothetical protein